MKLPGLIDAHVHLREPGGTHKEDWDSGTSAALSGGFVTVLAMPNTDPPIADENTLNLAFELAAQSARCDYGIFFGAGADNAHLANIAAPRAVGLKMYLDQTFGALRLDDMTYWTDHFKQWPSSRPISIHAESRSLAAAMFAAYLHNRAIHICHVSRREEILMIRRAKEKGLAITCEVCPHHLFLTQADIPHIGSGRSEVRPRLGTTQDRDALWENLDIIDIFASDHAPHTKEEKDSPTPPPGFPGLETTLPLFCNAVHENRLTWDDIVLRLALRPAQIFHLPLTKDTYTEIDPHASWEIQSKHLLTKCAWTPFEGFRVKGRVIKVVIRGEEVLKDGKVKAPPGFGLNAAAGIHFS